MSYITKFTVIVSILLIALAAVSAQERRLQVDNYIKEEMAKLHIPGAAVAVLRNGKIELIKGYGLANVDRKIPITQDTMFQIASTTKPFTAMAIMMLAEDGKLSPDEKAIKYLPWLPTIYSEITVRQLLTHTSGINRDIRTGNVDNYTIDEFKKRFAIAPVSFKPGEKWEYSNNGYVLLGLIVEAVSGKPFGEFLVQRITKPLGMNNTRYNEPPTDKMKNRAVGYDWLENTYKPSPYFAGGYTGGAIISTISDMAKWERAIFTGKLLKQSSFEQIWTPVKLNGGKPLSFEFRGEQSGYGFGWFLTSYKGHRLLTHGGTVSGFSSQILRFVDDKITIIMITNSKSGEDRIGYSEVLAKGIANLFLADSSQGNRDAEKIREPARQTEKELILEKNVAPHAKIDDVYRRFSEAYKKLDDRAVANLYTDDAFYLSPGSDVKRGREKITAEFSGYFDSVKNAGGTLAVSFQILDRRVSGDLAYDVGIYTTAEKKAKGETQTGRGKFVVLARRMQNGDWRFHIDSYNDFPKVQNDSMNARELEKLFDPIFAERMEKLHIPGAVISLVKDGKIVFTKGYGVADVEKKTSVQADKTIFRIGSITKVFTALAVMQLADNGKINLTDDVNKYLKGVSVPNTFSQPITFADLLTHTSGLDEISPGRRTSDESKIVPLGAFLKTRIVRHLPPREVISYSTYNPALAAHTVEQITQMPFKVYLQKNVFEPLGMNRTSITAVKNEYEQDLATGYEYTDNKYQKLPFQWFNTYPASDINSTATDMARFMIANLQYGTIDGKRILSEKAAREMQKTQFRNHPKISGWAYGFYEGTQNNLRFIEHGGSMDDGYSALMTLVPDKSLGIFVATNTENGGFGLGDAVKKALFNRYFPAQTKPEVPQTKNPSPDALKKFAGKYQSIIFCHSCAPNTSYVPEPFEVKVTDDGMLSFHGGRWKQIEPMVFVLADGERAGQVLFGFKENAKGEIAYMFQDTYMVYEKISQ